MCWTNVSHASCQKKDCAHAHVTWSKEEYDKLHAAVKYEVLRRGGLRSLPAIAVAKIPAALSELRSKYDGKFGAPAGNRVRVTKYLRVRVRV